MAVQEKNRGPGVESAMRGRREQMVGLKSWLAAVFYGREKVNAAFPSHVTLLPRLLGANEQL